MTKKAGIVFEYDFDWLVGNANDVEFEYENLLYLFENGEFFVSQLVYFDDIDAQDNEWIKITDEPFIDELIKALFETDEVELLIYENAEERLVDMDEPTNWLRILN